MRVDLSDGAWAELCDPRKVKQKYRRPILDAMGRMGEHRNGNGNGKPADTAEVVQAVKDAVANSPVSAVLNVAELTIIAVVEAWSLDLALPRDDPSVLDELAGADYDVLSAKATDMLDEMFVEFRPNLDESSPTSPSNA